MAADNSNKKAAVDREVIVPEALVDSVAVNRPVDQLVVTGAHHRAADLKEVTEDHRVGAAIVRDHRAANHRAAASHSAAAPVAAKAMRALHRDTYYYSNE